MPSSGGGCAATTTTPRTSTPTTSRSAPPGARSVPTGSCRPASTPGWRSDGRAGSTPTTIPIRSCMSLFKDGVAANTHCLNLLPNGASVPPVDRIPLYEVYMRMAEELAKRSTCVRLRVGTVVTDQLRENVLANRCDSSVPGSCGCIHSEMNALVKAPGSVRDKVVFISASPCVMCAKLIINSGVTHVFYRKAYRDPSGIEVLEQGGVVPVLYDRWVGEWR